MQKRVIIHFFEFIYSIASLGDVDLKVVDDNNLLFVVVFGWHWQPGGRIVRLLPNLMHRKL